MSLSLSLSLSLNMVTLPADIRGDEVLVVYRVVVSTSRLLLPEARSADASLLPRTLLSNGA